MYMYMYVFTLWTISYRYLKCTGVEIRNWLSVAQKTNLFALPKFHLPLFIIIKWNMGNNMHTFSNTQGI